MYPRIPRLFFIISALIENADKLILATALVLSFIAGTYTCQT